MPSLRELRAEMSQYVDALTYTDVGALLLFFAIVTILGFLIGRATSDCESCDKDR